MGEEAEKKAAGEDLGRQLSTHIVIFHQTIADHFGLSATENKCLDVLFRKGAMTAGQLAEFTGLTTGAITKIVDRLEKAGFAVRRRSQTDRRSVIIEPIAERAQEIGQIFASLSRAMAAVAVHYSEAERAVIHDYLSQMIAVLKEETNKLRAGMSPDTE